MKKINTACIIDDDPVFIFGTKRIMEIANFCNNTLVYNNGAEAYDSLKVLVENKQALLEVILLDLNMPIMDGWQFLDKITKIPVLDTLTIFIVTSSINPADIERANNYKSVTKYIIKPITVESLKEIMAAL